MPISEKEIIRFFERAKKFARHRIKQKEMREDFISFATLNFMEKGAFNLHWLLADFLRQTYGRDNPKSGHGASQWNKLARNPVGGGAFLAAQDMLLEAYLTVSDPIAREVDRRALVPAALLQLIAKNRLRMR